MGQKVEVRQRHHRDIPKTKITTKHGSPVKILSREKDWVSSGNRYPRFRVEVFSPLTGWKEQTILYDYLLFNK